ncbi:MAG: class 1 fructose-bisphosphatase [Planctomycetota bacterium]|jgi:fructose-1,6-bisphosphatase I
MHKDTLVEQFVRDQAKVPGASGELSTLLNRICLAGRMIALEIMKAGFVGRLGLTGEQNVQGEEVRALDLISNEIFLQVFENIDVVHSLASEEMDEAHFYAGERQGKYLLMFDPLDGSSNVNVNGPMGTIFSIHERKRPSEEVGVEDFLRTGSDQIAAGYVLYGPSTMFVYTAGGPVNGFTLDRSVGTFFLTHPNMQIPEGKGSYAVNESNEPRWDETTRKMVRAFRTGEVADRIGKRSARYIGALVADFHRTMVQGGIYMYPADSNATHGKLRLLYECAPLAMVARQAGGWASTGTADVLEVEATDLHHRVPLFIGSRGDVEEAVRLLNE